MDKLEKIKKRSAAAALERWYYGDYAWNGKGFYTRMKCGDQHIRDIKIPRSQADIDFILNAGKDIKWLLAEVERLLEAVKK